MADERHEAVQGRSRLEVVHVVQDDHERVAQVGQCPAETRDDRRRYRDACRAQRIEDVGRQRADPVDRHRQVGEQDDRIVVVRVERQPGERAVIGFGPQCEQRRLAVPGRRDDGHRRQGTRRLQPSRSSGRGMTPRRTAGENSLDSRTSTGRPRRSDPGVRTSGALLMETAIGTSDPGVGAMP